MNNKALINMSLEEQNDFWKDIVNTKEGRIKLFKIGMSQKEIENMYLIYNNIKVINTPILNELCQLKI